MKKIRALTGTGKYVIISEGEFFESVPESAEKNGLALRRALKAMHADGLIDLKYSGDDMFCVAPLKELPEPDDAPAPQKKSGFAVVCRKHAAAFAAAFLGGAAGSIIMTLIMRLALHA